MERTLAAFVAGVLVVLISSLSGYIKTQKILKKCLVADGAPGSFGYKGKFYDRNAYIQQRFEVLQTLKPKDLQKAVKRAEKNLAKSKNPQFDAVELEALKYALSLVMASK